jgi:energy-coupling factor transporter ATP-binding protein EcfA2
MRPAEVERIEWDDFLPSMRWRQGEHVSLIGPTGAGKTTLALEILPKRKYVVVLGTKPMDDNLSRLKARGYQVIREWPEHVSTEISPKLILWPSFRKTSDAKKQQQVIGKALQAIFAQGRWTVYADELRYIAKTLRMSPLLELLWQQGRSLGVSLVGGTQRPAHVPLMLYDQATHLFFWRDNDDANLKRIGGIGSLDARLVRDTVAALPHHETLYVNTRTGRLVQTIAPDPD